MGEPEPISQRDLRVRSREIMDAVEAGSSFTITRDGRAIGELLPLRRRRRFVPRVEFAEMSRATAAIDPAGFRADLDAVADGDLSDPYER